MQQAASEIAAERGSQRMRRRREILRHDGGSRRERGARGAGRNFLASVGSEGDQHGGGDAPGRGDLHRPEQPLQRETRQSEMRFTPRLTHTHFPCSRQRKSPAATHGAAADSLSLVRLDRGLPRGRAKLSRYGMGGGVAPLFLLGPADFREIRDEMHRAAQLRQQLQAVFSQVGIFDVDRHMVEKLVHRRA